MGTVSGKIYLQTWVCRKTYTNPLGCRPLLSLNDGAATMEAHFISGSIRVQTKNSNEFPIFGFTAGGIIKGIRLGKCKTDLHANQTSSDVHGYRYLHSPLSQNQTSCRLFLAALSANDNNIQ